MLDSKEGLPILDALRMLKGARIDSVSMSRDKPFCYFYARKNGNMFDVTIRHKDQEIDFKILMNTIFAI
jgi:hypothetical protein